MLTLYIWTNQEYVACRHFRIKKMLNKYILKVNYVTFYSNFADLKLQLKIQACFSQMFTNVNNICLQSTSKTGVSTYKLLFLVPRAVSLLVYRPKVA